MLLHLPIGIITMAFLFELLGLRPRFKDFSHVVPGTLLIGGILSLITAFLGYFLSLEGGYGEETLDIHMWLGITTTALTFILYYLKLKSITQVSLRKLYMSLLLVLMVILSAAGHYGGTLTHGERYLTQYLPNSIKSGLGMEISLSKERAEITDINEAVVYSDFIYYILDEKCVTCHNPNKKKGELLLGSPENITIGGENGDILVAGDPKNSTLFKLISLPEKHEDHMPPDGKKQLELSEIELLEWWIETGASFDAKIGDVQTPEPISAILGRIVEEQQRSINPVFTFAVDKASGGELEEAKKNGITLNYIARDKNLLQAIIRDPNTSIIEILRPFRDQLTWLDVSNISITDNTLKGIGEFTNLTRLYLNQTEITDGILEEIANLPYLEYLNLFGTKVSDEGVKHFKNHEHLKKLYLWQTDVSNSLVQELMVSNEDLEILLGDDSSAKMDTIRLASPIITVDRNFFKDKTNLTAEMRFEGVQLYYTQDGSEPDSTDLLYTEQLTINESTTIKMIAHKIGWRDSRPSTVELTKIDKLPESIKLKHLPSEKYKGSGPSTLIDMQKGSMDFRDGKWLGFSEDDLIADIDMGEIGDLKTLKLNYVEVFGSYIFGPTHVSVEVSKDGKTFEKVGEVNPGVPTRAGAGGLKTYSIPINKQARFVRVHAKNVGKCPPWHPGAGDSAWLFVDEIIVE